MQQQEDPIDQTKIKIKEGIEFALELIKKLSKSLAEQQREHYEIIKSLQINISITQIIEQDHQQAADIYNKTFDKDFWQNASEEEAFNCYATSCVWSHYSSEASTAKTHIESHIEERLLHLRGYYDQDPQAQQQKRTPGYSKLAQLNLPSLRKRPRPLPLLQLLSLNCLFGVTL